MGNRGSGVFLTPCRAGPAINGSITPTSFPLRSPFPKGHVRLFNWLPHIDNTILALNLIDMGATCLLPFATISFSSDTSSTAAVVFFGLMSLIICCSRLLTLYWARNHKLLVQPSPREEGTADAHEGRTWPSTEDAFYILRARLVVLFAASLFVVGLCFAVGSIGAVTLFTVPAAPMIAKYIPLDFFRPLRREKEVRLRWQYSVRRRLAQEAPLQMSLAGSLQIRLTSSDSPPITQVNLWDKGRFILLRDAVFSILATLLALQLDSGTFFESFREVLTQQVCKYGVGLPSVSSRPFLGHPHLIFSTLAYTVG